MEYLFGNFDDYEVNAKIQKCIEDVIDERFENVVLDLETIEFKEDEDFNPNDGGAYVIEDKKILLNYNSFREHVIHGNPAALSVLIHEIQHSANRVIMKKLFEQIATMKQYEHIKIGLETMIDEYIAEYKACFEVPDVSSGMLEGIVQINRDIKNKVTTPLKFYIVLLNVIPQTLGEVRAIHDKSGINILDQIFEKINDECFCTLIRRFAQVLYTFDIHMAERYIAQCEVLLLELMLYLNVDFDFMRKVEESL